LGGKILIVLLYSQNLWKNQQKKTIYDDSWFNSTQNEPSPTTYIKLLRNTSHNNRTNVERLLHKARLGIETCDPELIQEGEGGTYFLKDETEEIIAVFKPHDEEPFSFSNPKYRESNDESNNSAIKKGIRCGEAAIREVAAYLLDRDFAGVPLTVMVELAHPTFSKPKIGSLQEYVVHECGSWDLGPKKYTVQDVHKIGILDLRLFNVDRHGGNMLAQKQLGNSTYKLIPIDHGFSLPDSLDGTDLWFEWITWPQAKIPFDEGCLDFISKIDVEADATILRNLSVREECVRTMMITTTLLKKAAERGMTLHAIANLLYRKKSIKKKFDIEYPSRLELITCNLDKDSRSKYFLGWLENIIEEGLNSLFAKSCATSTTRQSTVGNVFLRRTTSTAEFGNMDLSSSQNGNINLIPAFTGKVDPNFKRTASHDTLSICIRKCALIT